MKSVKRIVLLAVLSVACACGFAQPLQFNPNNPAHVDTSYTMVLNMQSDFGALGNGSTNDHMAFEAASNFINARKGYAKLVIPAGTYRVGVQENGPIHFKVGKNVLELKECTKVEIEGVGNPILQYNDNMFYGYFNPLTGAPTNPSDHWLDSDTWATLGSCIYIFNCKGGPNNIKVSGLTVDGNMYPGKMIIGGYLVDINIQLEHYGVYVHGSGNVVLQNITARRFGLDGFIVQNNPDNQSHWNAEIKHCLSEYNGRMGVSVIGGRNITLNHSAFNSSGMGIIASAPVAGIDIEAEKEFYTRDLWRIYNVDVNNCIFGNNKNAGVVIVAGTTVLPGDTVYGNDFTFTNCEIYAGPQNSFAIDLGKYKKIKFDRCKITGAVFDAGNNAAVPEDGVKFVSCKFLDVFYKPYLADCYKVKGHTPALSSVVFATRDNALSRHLLFDSCTFDLYYKRLWNIYSVPATPARITNSVIRTSTTGGYIDYTQLGFDSNAVIQNNQFFFYDFQEYRHVQNGVYYNSPNIAGGNVFNYYNITTNPAPLPTDTLHGEVYQINGVDSCFFNGDRPPGTGISGPGPKVSGITLYPNPALNRTFTIKNTSDRRLSYTLFDMNGKQIENGELRRYEEKRMYFPQLTPGVYFLKIKDDQWTEVQKVVLQ